MDNEVEIVVRVKDHATQGVRSIGASVQGWARDVGDDISQTIGKSGERSRSNFMRNLFTPDPELVSRFTKPFANALATPVGAVVASALAVAISGAIGPMLVAGLGGALLMVGAFALRESDKLKAKMESTGKSISDSLARAAKPLEGPFVRSLDMIGKAFERLEPVLTRMFTGLAPSVEPLVAAFISLAENAMPGLEAAMPGIAVAFAALAETLPGLGTALGQFFTLISENKESIEKVTKAVVFFATGALVVMGKGLAAASGFLVRLIGVVQAAIGWFGRLRSGVSSRAGEVVSIIRGLPGRIRAALGNLGGLLVGAGRSVIDGLIGGVRAKIGELRATLAGITAMIPRIKGPLDKDRKLLQPAGQALIEGLMAGIDSRLGGLRGQLGGLTAGIPSMALPSSGGGRASAALAGAGAGGPFVIQLNIGGREFGEFLVDPMRKAISSRGGNVQGVLGS